MFNVQQDTRDVVHHSNDIPVHQKIIIAAVLQHYW